MFNIRKPYKNLRLFYVGVDIAAARYNPDREVTLILQQRLSFSQMSIYGNKT